MLTEQLGPAQNQEKRTAVHKKRMMGKIYKLEDHFFEARAYTMERKILF